VGVKYNAAHQMLLKKKIYFFSFMVAFAFNPDYEQEPQLNEMDFLEIDLLGPQPIRLTKSAITYSTIHQKTM
jgi:hypothetical protein